MNEISITSAAAWKDEEATAIATLTPRSSKDDRPSLDKQARAFRNLKGRHVLEKVIADDVENDHDNVLETLEDFGVQVNMIEHGTEHLRKEIKSAIFKVCRESRDDPDTERCLLYRSSKGQVFNLVLEGPGAGLAGKWKGHLESFSGVWALSMCVLFTRAFSCMNNAGGNAMQTLNPLDLIVITGFILTTESQTSSVSVAMLVQGVPSLSAYSFLGYDTSDWPKRVATLMLSASRLIAQGDGSKQIMYYISLFLFLGIYSANLGSRAWMNLKLPKLRYGRRFAFPLALFLACLLGLVVPYLGFPRAQVGGQVARERIIASAIVVGGVFIVSDLDSFQMYIHREGDTYCDQYEISMLVGIWLSVSSCLSLYFSEKLDTGAATVEEEGEREETLLDENHESPVGKSVPNLADFSVREKFVVKPHLPEVMSACVVVSGYLVSLGLGVYIFISGFICHQDKESPWCEAIHYSTADYGARRW